MQISRMDNTVPLSIVRCRSPSRIARPANSEPKALVISIAANREREMDGLQREFGWEHGQPLAKIEHSEGR
jgi:hypothetical protein